jgi:hypothetical protein
MVTTALGSAIESGTQQSMYQLPYPGILPDHPLYFLKRLRDRIINFLVWDPLKKSDLMLRNGDKNLSMTIALVGENKLGLAVATAKDGQGYIARSIDLLKEARKDGKDTKALAEKLSASLGKHEEVFLQLESRTQGDVRDSFTAMAKTVLEEGKSF